MAGGGDSNEMNPFISYVDLFSSIILVLLLFVLIMFVNVGYYMQFNSKNQPQSATPTTEVTPDESKSSMVFATLKQPTKEAVSQSDVGENSLTKAQEKTTSLTFKESDLVLVFNNNEYFADKNAVDNLIRALEKVAQVKPSAKFVLSVGDSQKIVSISQARQVSLARVLSLKNTLENKPQFKDKIQINYKPQGTHAYDFGYLKVDVK